MDFDAVMKDVAKLAPVHLAGLSNGEIDFKKCFFGRSFPEVLCFDPLAQDGIAPTVPFVANALESHYHRHLSVVFEKTLDLVLERIEHRRPVERLETDGDRTAGKDSFDALSIDAKFSGD